MSLFLSGKRILVTGAAVRIGRCVASRLAEAGARILVHCRRSIDEARSLLDELGGEESGHAVVQCDLTEEGAPERLIAELCRDEPLWGLMNNASVYTRAPMQDWDGESILRDFSVNAFAPIRLMCEFRRRCGEGSILNLLDQRVAVVEPGEGAYGLAKKTMRDATLTAALEWAPSIRVNGIAPGYVLPPPGVTRDAMAALLETVPLRRRTEPAEIAEAAHFLMTSPTVTGQVLFVDGGRHLRSEPPPERSHAEYHA